MFTIRTDADGRYITDKATLADLLFASDAPRLVFSGGRLAGKVCVLDSIQREDGSGRCFNLTVRLWFDGERTETVFVRTPPPQPPVRNSRSVPIF